jgi:nucleoside-diphosphate-sugar epimerase
VAGEEATVAITGAHGYVGSVLCGAFSDLGWRSISLVRRAPRDTQDTRAYDLAQPPSPDLLDGVDTLVHCAWDMSLTRKSDIWSVNVRGTDALLRLADRARLRRVIFVSSMSAYEGTGQIYGSAKLECERIASSLGHAVARLGLVYGPGWGGMAGSLRKMTRLPVIPLLAGNSHQFLVHQDDAAAAIVKLASASQIPDTPIGIAAPDPVNFSALLQTIAKSDGHAPHFAPMPWQPVYLALRGAEAVGLRMPFRADSLLGLARPADHVPSPEAATALGLSFRPFAL